MKTQPTKCLSKATSIPSARVTRASACASRLSTKRTAPTDHNSDILPQKRVKKSFEQSSAIASIQDNLDLQCASHALELLSHGGLRNYVIAAAITDRTIELLYYDRSIIIKSSPIDFVNDVSCFIAMLKGFTMLTPSQWGYEPLVKSPHISHPSPLGEGLNISLDILQGQTITLCDGKVLELGKTAYHQHGLIGRGTWVVRGNLQNVNEQNRSSDVDDTWDRGLIVKLSWSSKPRKSEDIIINEARSHAKACGDMWVLDHLPNILHAQDIDRTAEEPVKGLIELLGDSYEPRVLRLLVLEELTPITKLGTAPVLAEAFRGIFQCYEWLYTKPGIFHRDISVNNMMYREKDGKIFGVLNDYDLAIFKSNNAPSSKTRIGTKPFMAVDLLGNPADADVHRYRHDLESMFYVIVYVTSRYHEGHEIVNPPLQHWEEFGESALKAEKKAFLSDPPPPSTPLFDNFHIWINLMRKALLEGRSAHTDHTIKLQRTEVRSNLLTFD
ncbi:hypothetical protein BYT27DRAFT_7175755 [Phlegmacium glaucopus]|nr:hypothetical protein BYT27DRAFT_7175755 [Phlegmacium glaucopus]